MKYKLETHYRGRDIQKLFGIGQSTLYDYVSQGILPKPIKLGRTSIWLKSEIDTVIEKCKASREHGAQS